MTPGIVDYTDVGGGKELIKKPAIDEALDTFKGAPLTIGHIPIAMDHFEDVSNGTVDTVGFDSDKGWHFCEGTVETAQALDAIEKGWGVSAGTRVKRKDYGDGGMWLNNRYDKEIQHFRFHHLALVEPGKKPRFEEAEITRTNSTEKPPMSSFGKFIKKLVGADGKVTEQASEITGETRFKTAGDKIVLGKDLVEVRDNSCCHAIGQDDEIEYGGMRYNAAECVKAWHEKNKPAMPAGHHMEERPNSTAAEAGLETPSGLEKATPGAPPPPAASGGSPAEAKKADEKSDLERANAVAESEKSRLAEAVEAKRVADEIQTRKDNEEIERANASRQEGAESFVKLAGARVPRAPLSPPPMIGTVAAGIARGKQLFGKN